MSEFVGLVLFDHDKGHCDYGNWKNGYIPFLNILDHNLTEVEYTGIHDWNAYSTGYEVSKRESGEIHLPDSGGHKEHISNSKGDESAEK